MSRRKTSSRVFTAFDRNLDDVWMIALGQHFYLSIGRATHSAMWNLDDNTAFALVPRKATEKLDRLGRYQDLPDSK
jgi:hypothetical protein